MSKNLQLSELAFVVTASNYDPNLINPGFLTYSGIVPSEWELTKQPVISNRVSQLVYNNGVNIIAYPNRIMFVEALTTKSPEVAESPSVINRYTETLRNIDYTAVGINFRSYITCNEHTISDNQYVSKNFLLQGDWLKSGKSPVKAGISLMYEFEDNSLYLNINEATLQLPESQQVPVVLFTGNFNYDLEAESGSQKLDKLQKIFTNWHTDLENYLDVVNNFLKADANYNEELENELELIPAIAK
ncbi:MAG: hypothetical protein ACRC2V_27545 [Xenococcaceae cyanobacterium]